MPKIAKDVNSRGTLKGLENRSNVDVVVFGREQDNFDGELDETQLGSFEFTTSDWLGSKKRVGKLDTNNSRVDSIVFGVDLDGYDQTPAEIEAELRGMPEFRGAAGLCSVNTKDNKPASKVDLDGARGPHRPCHAFDAANASPTLPSILGVCSLAPYHRRV